MRRSACARPLLVFGCAVPPARAAFVRMESLRVRALCRRARRADARVHTHTHTHTAHTQHTAHTHTRGTHTAHTAYTQAFLTRKLKIGGSMGLALKLQPILDAAAPRAKL